MLGGEIFVESPAVTSSIVTGTLGFPVNCGLWTPSARILVLLPQKVDSTEGHMKGVRENS